MKASVAQRLIPCPNRAGEIIAAIREDAWHFRSSQTSTSAARPLPITNCPRYNHTDPSKCCRNALLSPLLAACLHRSASRCRRDGRRQRQTSRARQTMLSTVSERPSRLTLLSRQVCTRLPLPPYISRNKLTCLTDLWRKFSL